MLFSRDAEYNVRSRFIFKVTVNDPVRKFDEWKKTTKTKTIAHLP